VELSTLASYQGTIVSAHSTKHELAGLVCQHISNGLFDQEMSTSADMDVVLVPRPGGGTASSLALGISRDLGQSTKKLQPHEQLVSGTSVPVVTCAPNKWITLSPQDETLRLLAGVDDLQAAGMMAPPLQQRQQLPLKETGTVYLESSSKWRPCDSASERLLEQENLIFGARKFLSFMHSALGTGGLQPNCGAKGGANVTDAYGFLSSRIKTTSAKQPITGMVPAACGIKEQSNAETQTDLPKQPPDAVAPSAEPGNLVPITASRGAPLAQQVAAKICRFDGGQLGIVLGQQRDLSGSLRTVLLSCKVGLVNPSIAALLSAGDELVEANGQLLRGLSFQEQIALLRESPRPLSLTFVCST